MRLRKRGLGLSLFFLLTLTAYVGLKWQSRKVEQERLYLLKQKTDQLQKTAQYYVQAGIDLMKEISLGEQVVSAFQEKTSPRFGDIRFLLQAIQNKSSLPDVKISILDSEGNILWGGASQKNIDPALTRLGLFGEEHLYARTGGSFFYHIYLEGISPILKNGKVTGLVHIELPLERDFLNYLRESLNEEIFIYDKNKLQNSSLSQVDDEAYRKKYFNLANQENIDSKIKTAFLELSADRTKTQLVGLTPLASLGVVPLRGQGGEVVAMIAAIKPEKGMIPYMRRAESLTYWILWLFALYIIVRFILWFVAKFTILSPRVTALLFIGMGLLWIGAWIGEQVVQAYFETRLENKNKKLVSDLSKVYKEYNNYVLNSIGEERELLKKRFVRFLQGEAVPKPSQYEFVQLPLGMKKKSETRVTGSHIPVRWEGTGIFSEKANDPFSTETALYKVPVNRFAQKLWLVYSSAWGYPNKFGSPYGTKIGSVQVHFENGTMIQINLENGVNIHDRFFPLERKETQANSSKKAFEFISEEDPLTRLQYVEEIEFTIPSIYADSKIDYLLFEDLSSPDVPIFYAATLGVKKVPAFPARYSTIKESEDTFVLKKPFLSEFRKASWVYYQNEQIADTYFQDPSQIALTGTRASETVIQQVFRKGKPYSQLSSEFGFPAVVTFWPIKEKEFERPWGMMAVVTSAKPLENLEQIAALIESILFVLLLILGVVVLANFIVSWKKLRFKLVSYSFLVSFVPMLLVVSLLGYLLWKQEENAAQTRVAASLEQTRTFLSDVKKRAEDMALLITNRDDLITSVEQDQNDKVTNLLNQIKLNSFADFPGSFVVVKLSKGTEQTRQWGTSNYPTLPYSTKRLMDHSRNGLFFNQVSALVLGFSQISFSDIRQQTSQGQMSVYVGVPVNELFLAEMKRRIGTNLALYSADNLRASTFTSLDRNLHQKLNALARKEYSILMKEDADQFASLEPDKENGKEFLFQKTSVGIMPIKDDQNRLVGMIAAFSDYNQSLLSAFTSRKIILFFLVFILALTGLMSYIISRSITKPIAVLSKKADLIAQGKLGTTVTTSAKDEIGNLAESFNHMSSSLKDNHSRLEQKIADLLTMQKLSAKVSSVLEKEELMHLVVKLFCELSGFNMGMLLMRQPNSEHFVIESAMGMRKTDLDKTKYLPEETLAGLAAKEKNLVYIENHLTDLRVPHQSLHRKMHEKPMMILALPLIAKGKEQGAVVLERPAEQKTGVRVDEVLLMTLANHAAIALENAHLYEMAVEDGLTKVFVNRYFQFRLQEEVEHAKRYKTSLSLALIDLDSFKPINDNYGHQVGDEILIRSAQLMKKMFRSTDVVCRYGGDEFAVILPKTRGEEAVFICERLRKEIEKLDTPVQDKIILRVTLSIGVAAWEPGMDKEAFIKAADTALYASKTAGRNRVSRNQQSA